jgi:hypothetical protein
MIPTNDQIQKVLADNPGLSAAGFDVGDPSYTFEADEYEMIRRCCDWIEKNVTPTHNIRTTISSYGFKHIVERETGAYVINGAFIVAAILMGYQYRIRGGINACFNMTMTREHIKRLRGY